MSGYLLVLRLTIGMILWLLNVYLEFTLRLNRSSLRLALFLGLLLVFISLLLKAVLRSFFFFIWTYLYHTFLKDWFRFLSLKVLPKSSETPSLALF